MAQIFYKNTLESNFIKTLLNKTKLPKLEAVNYGKYIIKGRYYIYKSFVIKCIEDGAITKNPLESGSTITVGKNIRCSTSLLVGSTVLKPSVFKVVANFSEVKDKYISTETFTSNNIYYDTNTHEYLGKYLKYYESLYDINLFPFYNCFSYRTADDFSLSSTIVNNNRKLKINSYSDTNTKIYLIKVDFNTTYTIAINSVTPLIIKPLLYNQLGIIKGDYNKVIESFNYSENDFIYKNSTMFTRPFTVNIPTSNTTLIDNEKSLYLAIQLSKNVNSTITVLRGDYTNKVEHIINLEDNLVEYNKIFSDRPLSKLSLLSISDDEQYAYSNRLIEYLLDNVVTPFDVYGEDFERIYNLLKLDTKIKYDWNNNLDYTLYTKYCKTNRSKFDINGLVDKDIEDALMKGELG